MTVAVAATPTLIHQALVVAVAVVVTQIHLVPKVKIKKIKLITPIAIINTQLLSYELYIYMHQR